MTMQRSPWAGVTRWSSCLNAVLDASRGAPLSRSFRKRFAAWGHGFTSR